MFVKVKTKFRKLPGQKKSGEATLNTAVFMKFLELASHRDDIEAVYNECVVISQIISLLQYFTQSLIVLSYFLCRSKDHAPNWKISKFHKFLLETQKVRSSLSLNV